MGCRARALARVAVLSTTIVGVMAILAPPAVGQASSRPCPPSGERVHWIGTCQTAVDSLGPLPQQTLSHWNTYPTLAAATSDKVPRGTVVESLGQIWLFTIAERGWRPRTGTRVATIGPLPLTSASAYTAVYMQSIFEPGTTTLVHAHSGPEAFFTLSGGTCLGNSGRGHPRQWRKTDPHRPRGPAHATHIVRRRVAPRGRPDPP